MSRTLIGLLAFFLPATAIFSRVPPRQEKDSASIQGAVRDSSGAVVVQATVILQSKSGRAPIQTQTDAEGKFVIPSCPSDAFTLRISKQGISEIAAISFSLSAGEKKQIDVVLQQAPASDGMEFSDEPSFTVAGVTDWSNAGLHGSDTRERTSETLTKETVALSPEGGKPNADGTADAAIEKELRADLVRNPGSFEANRRLGRLCLRSRRFAEAIPLLQAAYRVKPTDTANSFDLALAYKANGDLPSARKQLEQLIAETNDAGAYRLLGDVDEEQGDSVAAAAQYEKAVQTAPTEENYFAWGTELLLHRANQPAVEVYTRGSSTHPDSLRLRLGLAAGLFASGAYEAAARNVCEAADLHPGDKRSYLFLGAIEKATVSPLECSEARLARFARENPENSLANYYYATSLWKRARASQDVAGLGKIQALLEKSVAIDPKFGEAYLQLGVLLSEQGRSQQAIDNLQRAVAVAPDLPDAHHRLALAYKRAGEESKAQVQFQAYEQAEKAETAAIEKQRRELRQFIVVLKDQPAAPSQN